MCDFTIYNKNQDAQACDLTLSQFRRSPVLLAVQQAINDQAIDLYSAEIDGLGQRCLDNAIGYQLDVIGRIVGQDRTLQNFAKKAWFTYDAPNLGYDSALFYSSNAQIGGDFPADDEQYSQLIQAKIFRNHVKYGSIPEIQEFCRILYDINVSIRKDGNSDLTLIVPDTTPDYIIQNLLSFDDTNQADKIYFLPIPTTGRIVGLIKKPSSYAFTYDRAGSGYDQGLWSIVIKI